MKLLSKNSNLCDHNPPTSQTDRRTDRRRARPPFALKHGKNGWLPHKYQAEINQFLA